MKDNMLLISAVVIIVALFTVAVALYSATGSVMNWQGQPASDAAASNVTATPIAGAAAAAPETALEALSVASADPAVRSWTAGQKVVFVADVSSDFCSGGLADTWTITYATGDGQIMACVVQGQVVETHAAETSPQQGIDASQAIDSDAAWQSFASCLAAAGVEAPQVVAETLKVSGGRPQWDLSYQAADGFHVVRVDAGNGSVIENATIGT